MKNIIISLLFPLVLMSQSKIINPNTRKPIVRCGSTEFMDKKLEDATYAKAHRAKMQKFAETDFVPYKALCTNTTTLPMAIHYQGSIYNNLTVAQKTCLQNLALSQVQVLNDDFAGTNADISTWNNSTKPNYFPNITHGETCIRFCLATQNHPTGYNLTNGQYAITYNQTTGDQLNNWAGYINIFVRADNQGILGYSPLGGLGNGDGIFVNEDAFGTGYICVISPQAPFNKGRTLTHEMGHYLLLNHIWGDDGTACTGSDNVADTPNQADENYGCPNISTNTSCSNGHDLSCNYLDYSNDACMYMFTAGQKSRMETYLASNLTAVKNNYLTKCSTTCNNGVQDGNETGVDCGGTCSPCPTCSDGIQNQNETGIDCGGVCIITCPTCTDGIQNGTETGVDCGGSCPTACPLCSSGTTSLLSQSFGSCSLPSGWTTSHTTASANNEGNCKDNLAGTMFSFNCTNEYPFTGTSTGATPTAGFSGCLAVIDDDDLATSQTNLGETGTGCIITNAINTTAYSTLNLAYDYQNEPYGTNGVLTVDVWNGSSWINVQTTTTSASAHASINISAYSNAALKVRFCYNDEGDWAWGAAIDNVAICGSGTATSCTDGIQNGNETGIDCGGSCPSPADPNITVTNSTCQTGCTLGGGSFTIATGCGTGTLTYFSNATGSNPTTTQPTYNQSSPITIYYACVQGNCTGTIESLTTSPGTCPTPADPNITVTNSTCQTGCTLGGGSFTIATGCGAGTLTYFSDASGSNPTTTQPTYNQSSPITIYYACVQGNCRGTIESLTTSPGSCPTPADPNITVTNSTCQTGCTLGGGSFTIATGCGAGTLTYFSDVSGSNPSTTQPTYNQSSPITIYYACVQGNCRGTIESLTTSPGSCPTPADPNITVTNSICQTGCTLGGGSFTIATGCGAGTLTYFSDATGSNPTISQPVYNQTSPITIYYACVQENCTGTIESLTTSPGSCTADCTCTDGIQNGDETGVDCGGSCPNSCQGFRVKMKALLEGPFSITSGEMTNALRTSGILPLGQPFNVSPFNYNGSESVNSYSQIPIDIVDWVLVEARSSSNLDIVLETKACWINQSGQIIDLDGQAGVYFSNLVPGSYHFALYHKGHLAILTANSLMVPNANAYDFTLDMGQANGIQQLKLKGSVYVLFAGDVDNNSVINNLDYNAWASNSAAVSQYLHFDIDCNGVVNNLDYNLWYANRSKVGNFYLQ